MNEYLMDQNTEENSSLKGSALTEITSNAVILMSV